MCSLGLFSLSALAMREVITFGTMTTELAKCVVMRNPTPAQMDALCAFPAQSFSDRVNNLCKT